MTRPPLAFRPSLESLGDRLAPATFAVTTGADGGPGSFRDAIQRSNVAWGADTITFNFPLVIASGPSLAPASPLPTITDRVTIDASQWPVELNGANAGATADGLTIAHRADGSTIRGFIINRFGGNGIRISDSNNNTIEGCTIGTDRLGTAVGVGNRGNGILIENGSSDNLIGRVGLSAANLTLRPGNVISGNSLAGIAIRSTNSVWGDGNRILGNVIGTNAAGTASLPNGTGMHIEDAHQTEIGGPNTGEGNLISGNVGAGVYVPNSTEGTRVTNNRIGTDVSGRSALGNFHGVRVDTFGATIADNTIGGNRHSGVVTSNGSGSVVVRNRIGVGSGTGSDVRVPNAAYGVLVTGSSRGNQIGSLDDPSYGNTIAYNGGDGVAVLSGRGNTIASNRIYANGGLAVRIVPTGFPAPAVVSAVTGGASQVVTVSLPELSSEGIYAVQLYANPGPTREGRTLLTTYEFTVTRQTLLDQRSGKGPRFRLLVSGLTEGAYVTATLTDSEGSTSEFSGPVRAGPATL